MPLPAFVFRIRPKSLLCVAAFVLAGGLLSLCGAPASERGRPFVQAFAVRDYGEHSQNWCAVQDRAGTLYIGNSNVVLAYDGLEWRSLEVGGQFIRGLALDPEDRVCVGGVNQLGYLADDGRGGRTFVSLRERLPEAERDFRDIRRVIANRGGVYFLCDDRVLRWHEERFTVERFGAPAYSCELDNEVVVSAAGQPLRALRDGQWRVVSDAPELANRRVVAATRLPDGAALFATVQHGLWRFMDGRVEPF